MEEQTQLDPIAAKDAALRLKHKHVYKISIISEDDRELFCWVRRPSVTELSMCISNSSKDPLGSDIALLRTCWLDGDQEIKDDEYLELAASKEMGTVIEIDR